MFKDSEKDPVKQDNDQSETKITMKIPFDKKAIKGTFNVSVSFKDHYQFALRQPVAKLKE